MFFFPKEERKGSDLVKKEKKEEEGPKTSDTHARSAAAAAANNNTNNMTTNATNGQISGLVIRQVLAIWHSFVRCVGIYAFVRNWTNDFRAQDKKKSIWESN